MSTSALLPMLVAALAAGAPSPVVPSSTAASTTAPPKRVLVVPSGDVAVDASVREGVPGDGFALVDEAATTSVLADARAVGVACDAADGACWSRLAELGGFDVVVFVVGDVVTKQAAGTTTTATAARHAGFAFTAATRRAFGVAGEVRVRATPPTAAVVIDDVVVAVEDGVAVASVSAGTHRVLVRAPGFVGSESAVGVSAGSVVDVPVELAAAAATSSSWSPWLRDGGIGVLAVTVATVGGLVAWGQVPYLACYDTRPPAGCAVDGEITQTANTTALAAVIVGVVGGLVGGGAVIAGVVGE